MRKPAEDVSQSATKIVPAARSLSGRTVLLIPKKQYRVKQVHNGNIGALVVSSAWKINADALLNLQGIGV
jgi:hypothetical protein